MSLLFVNRLTTLDLSLLHPSRGLLGQSWLLGVELEGTLDPQGMVLDFSEVKRRIKHSVDYRFDHRLAVPAAYPGCQISQTAGHIDLQFVTEAGAAITYSAPAQAVALIDAELITVENMSSAICESIGPELPENVQRLDIGLQAEEVAGASYQYSHGLRHHEGNCQRIAHGHRSRIQIYRNGSRCPELERDWANRWRDIYIGTREHLCREFQRDGIGYAHFGYTASQGRFDLTLPRERCYLVDFESTVENLASHISDRLHSEYPGSSFRVMAYEGIDKGAIGFSEA